MMSTQSTPSTDPLPVATPTLTDEETNRLNSLAEEVDIDSIIIGDRVRRDFSHVPRLAEEIQEHGLIQPIVLTYDRRLVAGESRIRAHRLLKRKTIRAVFRGVLDDAQLHILEVTENTIRKELTWQERCMSIDRVHRYKTTEAAMRGKRWGVRETGELLNQGKTQLATAIFIAEALHANDKEVWAAESLTDAYRVLCNKREQEMLKAITLTTVPTVPKSSAPSTIPIPQTDFFADDKELVLFEPGVGGVVTTTERPGQPPAERPVFQVPITKMIFREGSHTTLSVMRSLGPEAVDHIITDPPYGIDMEMLNQSNPHGKTVDIGDVTKEHDVEENLSLLSKFIDASFDCLRDRGFLVFWCDPVHWFRLTELCEIAGFRVQRWPLVWHKTSACINQAAGVNFTKNIEFAVVARKGNATLLSQQPSCVYTGGSDIETRLLGHPFAKPTGLWEWVYRATCQKGAEVLDPFTGVGSSFLPAVKLGLRPRGIECNEKHFGRLTVNVQNYYRSIDPTCVFV